MSTYYYTFPIGKIGISEDKGKITNIYFSDDCIEEKLDIKETPILKEAYRQLNKYFKGELKEFDLPLNPKGTDFMKKTWNALCDIPYGTTMTYKEIANKIGNPNASRAVGNANNKNPIPIVIPCHRVIGSNGKLTGYRGGLNIKEKLLKLEQIKKR